MCSIVVGTNILYWPRLQRGLENERTALQANNLLLNGYRLLRIISETSQRICETNCTKCRTKCIRNTQMDRMSFLVCGSGTREQMQNSCDNLTGCNNNSSKKECNNNSSHMAHNLYFVLSRDGERGRTPL